MRPSDYDLELEVLHNKSVGRLFSVEIFSPPAFDELYRYLCQKAEAIKSEHVISKQVVSVLLSAQHAIENCAPYNTEARSHLSMANQFSMLLELIAKGEVPNERQAGVPRVV